MPIERDKHRKVGVSLEDSWTQSHYYHTARATIQGAVICSIQSMSFRAAY